MYPKHGEVHATREHSRKPNTASSLNRGLPGAKVLRQLLPCPIVWLRSLIVAVGADYGRVLESPRLDAADRLVPGSIVVQVEGRLLSDSRTEDGLEIRSLDEMLPRIGIRAADPALHRGLMRHND